ncbi:MAG: PrgI family protein [Candidatus Paceibacterota bacterium]|jgi:hypothetical protein
MQYHVPQFLEVEDKIFGQLTFKQFLYIFGGLGLAYLAYVYLKIYFSIPIIIVSVMFSGALAFAKVNNKPFIYIVDAFIRYVLSPRLYIWKKLPKKKTGKDADKNKIVPAGGVYVPPLSESGLKDLAWSLDIKEHDERNVTVQKKAPLLKDI